MKPRIAGPSSMVIHSHSLAVNSLAVNSLAVKKPTLICTIFAVQRKGCRLHLAFSHRKCLFWPTASSPSGLARSHASLFPLWRHSFSHSHYSWL